MYPLEHVPILSITVVDITIHKAFVTPETYLSSKMLLKFAELIFLFQKGKSFVKPFGNLEKIDTK